jgi:hypothetical protein
MQAAVAARHLMVAMVQVVLAVVVLVAAQTAELQT